MEATLGSKIMMFRADQSTYVPQGEVHRVVNSDSIPLQVIEIQSGSYLGEDDIVRMENNCGRETQGIFSLGGCIDF